MRAVIVVIFAAVILSRFHHFTADAVQRIKFASFDSTADDQIAEWTAKRDAAEAAEQEP